MDLSLIKQKLGESQNQGKKQNNKGQKYEKIDYTKIYWKPKEGEHQVRIVPSKFDKNFPFQAVQLHYGFAKFPIAALTNWKETDPIVEFAKGLRKSSDKEDWQLAKKVEPKTRYFAPVLVRGEEHLGVRLWEFGKLVYEQLLKIAADEDYGDYTSITDGRDFKVEAAKKDIAGETRIQCTIIPKVKTSPITNDAAALEKYLNEQPDIFSVHRKRPFDELKDILQKWLAPDEDEKTVVEDATDTDEDVIGDPENDFLAPFEADKKESKYSAPVKEKSTNADKFTSMFDE